MINNRRSELDILADILSLSGSSAKKTKIMYGANLSYARTQNYLAFLLNKTLLEERNDLGREYKTTKKGFEFLNAYTKIRCLTE